MELFGFYLELWLAITLFSIAGVVAAFFLALVVAGLLSYKRYPKSEVQKKYAFFIPARNEENVIANTIASIRAMDYPQDKITIFILANNCSETDRTAAIAKELGEEVFELKDSAVINVGMVIKRFFQYVKTRFGGFDAFDGYVRLDADNLVHKDYMSKLNDAFCVHPTVVTSYRANQNFNDGVKASLTCMLMSQSMMAFRLFSGWGVNPIITGPGVLIGADVLTKMDGWNCTTISEDLELSAMLIKMKIKAHFCYDAIFYDEQPNKLKIAFRQRLRWTTGTFAVFRKYWFTMIARVFSKVGLSALFMVIGLVPMGFLTVTITTGFAVYGFVSAILQQSFTPAFMFIVMPVIFNIVLGWFMAVLTFVVERKRINISSLPKRLLYIFAFPVSYAMQNIADFVRIFVRIKWKPIPHGQVKNQQAVIGNTEQNKEK